jgi:heptosyltransferase-1
LIGTKTLRNVLIARTDKIGDLLLSLPVFQTLKKAFPYAKLTALVSPYAKEIVQSHPSVDAVELYENGEGLLALTARFKEMEIDVFIALYPRPKQAFAAWLAGIPTRIGTAYRWYSFLFTEKIKVHRSAADRHEVEYNLDLLKPMGLTTGNEKIQFPLTESERSFAKDLLKEKGIQPGTPYVVVHPGHKGSALNWNPVLYGQIVAHLTQQKNLRVVITAGADETPLISKVTQFHGSLAPEQKPVLLIGECGLRHLAAVYEGAACFLSGSTGTMHLAAAVGTPTVSLFCPIPETTPVRWGPWGNEATILMPKNLKCPDCLRGYCGKHDPMDAITVDEVFQAMEKYIRKALKK